MWCSIVLETSLVFDFTAMYKTGTKRFCGHCNQYVSPATLKKHKANFYDCKARKWITQQTCKRMDTRVVYRDLDVEDDRMIMGE